MDFLSPGQEADQMQADQIDLKEFLLSLSRGAQSRGANGFPFWAWAWMVTDHCVKNGGNKNDFVALFYSLFASDVWSLA